MNKLNKQAENIVYSMRNSNPKQAEIEIGEPERVREKESKQSLSLPFLSPFSHRDLLTYVSTDLHVLYVSEAVERAKVAMDKARSKGKSQLRIIVGKASMKYRKVQVEGNSLVSFAFVLRFFVPYV